MKAAGFVRRKRAPDARGADANSWHKVVQISVTG